MITELNTKINQSDIIAGTGITVTPSWSGVIIGRSNTSGNVTSQILTVANGACQTAGTIPYKTYTSAFVDESVTTWWTPWAEANPTGTIDADNTSTFDANIIDNNYTNLVYNNSITGSANKSLPGIDLWSSIALQSVDIYWWTPATYGTTNGRIQWSNDGTTWTNLVTGIVKNTGATWDVTSHTVSWSWRYIRFFNVTWQNVTYIVLAEIEAFTVWTPWVTTTENIHISDYDMQIRNDAGFLEVCNNEASTYTLEINSIQ